jgi:hypothetical protein
MGRQRWAWHLHVVLASILAGCGLAPPSAADCPAMAPNAPMLAATGQTDSFGDVVVIGTITASEVQARRGPPVATFELAVSDVLRGQADDEESVYVELEDGLSLSIEEEHLYVVAGERQLDGRLRIVGCNGVAVADRIDPADAAALKASSAD